MKRLIPVLAVVAGLVVPATADAWTGSVFKTPGGIIICKYRAAFDNITCRRRSDKRIVSMNSTQAARRGIRLSWRGQAVHTLPYGSKYSGAGKHITCFSGTNGIRCTNWHGHGFFLSRTMLSMW